MTFRTSHLFTPNMLRRRLGHSSGREANPLKGRPKDILAAEHEHEHEQEHEQEQERKQERTTSRWKTTYVARSRIVAKGAR